MKEKVMQGQSYTGNPHVRFNEGVGAPARSGRSALLYKNKSVFTKIKTISLATILSLSLGFCGCSDGSSKNKEKSIQESVEPLTNKVTLSEEELTKRMIAMGQATLDLMFEKLHNENFLKCVGGAILKSDAYELLSKGEYSKPEKIYEITVPDELIIALISKEATSEGFQKDWISESLLEELRRRMVSLIHTSMTTTLSLRRTMEEVSALAFISTEKNYIDMDMKGYKKILIYVYKDAYPHAYPLTVSFVGDEEGVVRTSASAILQKEFKAGDAEELQKTLADLSLGLDAELLTGLKIKRIK